MELLGIALLAILGVWGYQKWHKSSEASSGGSTGSGFRLPELPPADFEEVAKESGWFVEPLPPWLVEEGEKLLKAASRGMAIPKTALRDIGEQASKEEKRALGVRSNAKMAKPYMEALSEKGRKEQPLNAGFLVLLRCSSRQSRKDSVRRAMDLEGQHALVAISSSRDERDCNAIKQYEGKLYKLDDLPVLPLESCDSVHCRCVYQPRPQIP
ncbi:hypothetical protein [Guyparkeria sp. SCN-R1]|uniref:hypothetical protein n=1 Tax=Guyparkeria sp. SCN-R1 TaxID=2341113 RepID=UPI000F647751|nr:hypothetical protein [Guyparkeria sp. SCN-R1]